MAGKPAIKRRIVRRVLSLGQRQKPALSQRQIAALCGISLGTVNNILTGKHLRTAAGREVDKPIIYLDRGERRVQRTGPRREICPGCGGTLIVKPCRLCHVRRVMRSAA